MARKFREAIRVDKVAIRGPRWISESNRLSEESKFYYATHERWTAISESIRRISNFVWRYWLAWHTDRGHDLLIVDYMKNLRNWNRIPKENRIGEKPKCSISPWPAEFARDLIKAITARYPDVNLRSQGLALQKLMGVVKNGPGVKSAYPRWMQILADEVGCPGYQYALPIPLCNKRCFILPPEKEGDDFRIEFRIDRINQDEKNATSTKDVFMLKTRFRTREVCQRLIDGVYHRNGGLLTYDPRKNCWFFLIGYRQPPREKASILEGTKAVVTAGEKSPIVLEIDGHEIPIGWKAENVAALRMMLDAERNSRSANYRFSPGVAKGHGRKRARNDRFVNYINRWARFCKSANYEYCSHVLRICRERKIEKIIFHQPNEKTQGKKLLFLAGKTEHTRIANGWPWHRLASVFMQKTNEIGMKCEIVNEIVDENDLVEILKESPKVAE